VDLIKFGKRLLVADKPLEQIQLLVVLNE